MAIRRIGAETRTQRGTGNILTAVGAVLTVVFPTAFAAVPVVNATMMHAGLGMALTISEVTRTGFTIKAFLTASAAASNTDCPFSWTAVGN